MAKYGATGVHKIHSYFSTSGGVLSFYRDNASTQLAFGESGTGLDVKFWGDTVSAWVLWDESADTLQGASSAVFAWGGAASFAGVVAMTGSVAIAGAVNLTGAVTASGDVTFTGSTNVNDLLTVSAAATFQGNIVASGNDFAVNSASIKLGNASTDRIGFFGATATIQVASGTAASTALIQLGLMIG